MENFICQIASIEEMEEKWNYEIDKAIDDKQNWIIWKEKNIKNFIDGYIIPYYGILNGKIICEATVHLTANTVQNSKGLVDNNRVYLSAFRTNKEYEYATLGIEPTEEKNKLIYSHYGFTKCIKNSNETYPDGTIIEVEYYEKVL